MTQRTNPAASSTAHRLWTLGSVLLIGATAVAFSASALAGGHRDTADGTGPHGPSTGEACMHGGMMVYTRQLDRLQGLKLTDAQHAQIRDIQAQARADLGQLREQGRSSMHHGMSWLSEAKPDAVAAEKGRQEMLAQHDKVSQRMLKAQIDMANVLTPAQRAQLSTAMKARQSERAERRAAHRAERAASQPAPRPSSPR